MIVLLVSENGIRLVFLGSVMVIDREPLYYERILCAVLLYHLPSRPLCFGHESSHITHVAVFITSVEWEYRKLKWACSIIEF
jgi:hypothetical protein